MQRGWNDLDALPSRTRSREVLVDLKETTALLFIQDGRVTELRAAPAPDGRYELQRSGTVVVEKGQVREVVGIPEAPATMIPSP